MKCVLEKNGDFDDITGITLQTINVLSSLTRVNCTARNNNVAMCILLNDWFAAVAVFVCPLC